jgi:hypothetical protein
VGCSETWYVAGAFGFFSSAAADSGWRSFATRLAGGRGTGDRPAALLRRQNAGWFAANGARKCQRLAVRRSPPLRFKHFLGSPPRWSGVKNVLCYATMRKLIGFAVAVLLTSATFNVTAAVTSAHTSQISAFGGHVGPRPTFGGHVGPR